MTDDSKVKVFCIYNKNNYLIQTDAITPIQVSKSLSPQNMKVIQTCTGDNISDRCDNYAEIAAWYWVWKNYMPLHKDLPYIGFCHYRRFLSYGEAPDDSEYTLERISLKDFARKGNLYTSDFIYSQIKDYDVVVPKRQRISPTLENKLVIETQYLQWHPKKDLEIIKKVICEFYPEYRPTMDAFLNGKRAYFCLLFTMKRELMEEFLTWAFDILFKVEKLSDWSGYKDYNNIRTPAFLMERFFNVWLEHNRQKRGLKVLERLAYFLDIPTEIKK